MWLDFARGARTSARVGGLSLAAAIALLLAMSAPARAQSCPEPSALDLDATAEPLRVARSPSGGLDLTWQDVATGAYRLQQGTILRLHAGVYDHVPVSTGPETQASLAMPAGNAYFVVGAVCAGEESSIGRARLGRHAHPGSHVRDWRGADSALSSTRGCIASRAWSHAWPAAIAAFVVR